MSSFFRSVVLILFVALLPDQAAFGQALVQGEWRLLMRTPGGESANAIFKIGQADGSKHASIEWRGGRVEITDFRQDEDLLSFSWDPGFPLQCRLERAANGRFKGGCLDELGNVSPVGLAPLSFDVNSADLDIEKALELFDTAKKEDPRERSPQPGKPDVRDGRDASPLPSRMVELDGRRVKIVEVGSGDVTIVLVSGVGDDHRGWRRVQDALARRARVVSYDRPGLGSSEPSLSSRSPSAMARELHDVLEAAGYASPYVFVGHQAGGLVLRQYQAFYPDEVEGLVLVDPAHELEDERYSALDANSWTEYLSWKHSFLETLSDAAAQEFRAYQTVLERNAAPAPSPLNIPVIVLSGQLPVEAPQWVFERDEGLDAKEELHRSLAQKLGGRFVASRAGTTHLHMKDPGLVVSAVEQILDAIGQ